jgi:hypothetical protein
MHSDERDAVGIHALVQRYSGQRFFQVRIVARTVLVEVAAALKGVCRPLTVTAYGNTR